jgi:hypothetical protein
MLQVPVPPSHRGVTDQWIIEYQRLIVRDPGTLLGEDPAKSESAGTRGVL